jgi:hypothetical protein
MNIVARMNDGSKRTLLNIDSAMLATMMAGLFYVVVGRTMRRIKVTMLGNAVFAAYENGTISADKYAADAADARRAAYAARKENERESGMKISEAWGPSTRKRPEIMDSEQYAERRAEIVREAALLGGHRAAVDALNAFDVENIFRS